MPVLNKKRPVPALEQLSLFTDLHFIQFLCLLCGLPPLQDGRVLEAVSFSTWCPTGPNTMLHILCT